MLVGRDDQGRSPECFVLSRDSRQALKLIPCPDLCLVFCCFGCGQEESRNLSHASGLEQREVSLFQSIPASSQLSSSAVSSPSLANVNTGDHVSILMAIISFSLWRRTVIPLLPDSRAPARNRDVCLNSSRRADGREERDGQERHRHRQLLPALSLSPLRLHVHTLFVST